MGGQLCTHFFPTRGKKKLKKLMEYHWRYLQEYYGHREGYAGELHMLPCEPIFKNKSFRSRQRAEDWIGDNHEKRDAPFAVKFTEDGVHGYLVGGVCPC